MVFVAEGGNRCWLDLDAIVLRREVVETKPKDFATISAKRTILYIVLASVQESLGLSTSQHLTDCDKISSRRLQTSYWGTFR